MPNPLAVYSYNPKGTIQSKEYHMDTLSWNIFVYRNVKRAVNESSGAPKVSGHHSKVNAQGDIETILGLMQQERVGQYHEGRSTTGSKGSPIELTEGTDAVTVGLKYLYSGVPLNNIVKSRMRRGWEEMIPQEEVTMRVDEEVLDGDDEGNN